MKQRMLIGLVGVIGVLFAAATAQPATVVALGASNTFGKGVSRSQAYPAQLEALLRGKGSNARVINAGINGDTTGGMLARLKSCRAKGNQRCDPAARWKRQTQAGARQDGRDPGAACLNGRQGCPLAERYAPRIAASTGRPTPDPRGLSHVGRTTGRSGGRGAGALIPEGAAETISPFSIVGCDLACHRALAT